MMSDANCRRGTEFVAGFRAIDRSTQRRYRAGWQEEFLEEPVHQPTRACMCVKASLDD